MSAMVGLPGFLIWASMGVLAVVLQVIEEPLRHHAETREVVATFDGRFDLMLANLADPLTAICGILFAVLPLIWVIRYAIGQVERRPRR